MMDQAILRLLFLALVFSAVVLGVEGSLTLYRRRRAGGRAINHRLRLIAEGVTRGDVLARLRREGGRGAIRLPGPLAGIGVRLDRLLRAAGWGGGPRRVLLTLVSVTLLLFLTCLGAAVVGGFRLGFGLVLMTGVFSAGLGLGVPMLILSRRADRCERRLAEQFPLALDVFVRGLRAGHPVAAALDLLTSEMTDPIGSEFGIVADEVLYGADLRDALQGMAARCDLDDLRMFVVSLSIQSETGGNLAEILENLSKVIRERASMMLMVRALSSEGRMTATILTTLPVVAFVSLFLLSPAFYLDVAGDPAFTVGFGALLALYLAGFVTIRRLVDLKV